MWRSNCNIACGDDGVVVKCSRQRVDFGECANIHVHDCVIETQDAGLKIGTETTSDVHDMRFERCQIKTSSRGLCIQLRDEGNVYNIDFRDITFVSRFYGDPWWGRGEAISFTAIPRTAATQAGHAAQHDGAECDGAGGEQRARVRKRAIAGARCCVGPNVAVTLDRTTQFKGGLYRQSADDGDGGD
jgi:hypothetical protein